MITIFVSTHFMNEAMRCDRISLMHAGRVLACDTPQALIDARDAPNLETAFIAYIEDAIGASKAGEGAEQASFQSAAHGEPVEAASGLSSLVHSKRLLAYSYRETLEILRDPVRLAFAFAGSALLMLVFGFGITTDVEDIRFAELDYDQSPESRAYLESFASSRSFLRQRPLHSPEEMLDRLVSNDITVGIEVPSRYGLNLQKGAVFEASALIDGANPFRAETIKEYVQGVNTVHYDDLYRRQYGRSYQSIASEIQSRFTYNPSFESVYAIVPSVPPILLILIPAILMAVSVVREKELGTMINFYVTPSSKVEFLIGKQLPYIVIGMVNFVILTAMAIFVFGIPIKGNAWVLTLCALAYITVTTSIGLLVSSFTSSQVAAVFVTAILTILPTTQFSGMLQPVSTLQGSARVVGTLWPTTYYMRASIGAFTKGLGAGPLLIDALLIAAFIPVLILLTVAMMRRQES
jgi:ribosome-dependent ATPase